MSELVEIRPADAGSNFLSELAGGSDLDGVCIVGAMHSWSHPAVTDEEHGIATLPDEQQLLLQELQDAMPKSHHGVDGVWADAGLDVAKPFARPCAHAGKVSGTLRFNASSCAKSVQL